EAQDYVTQNVIGAHTTGLRASSTSIVGSTASRTLPGCPRARPSAAPVSGHPPGRPLRTGGVCRIRHRTEAPDWNSGPAQKSGRGGIREKETPPAASGGRQGWRWLVPPLVSE